MWIVWLCTIDKSVAVLAHYEILVVFIVQNSMLVAVPKMESCSLCKRVGDSCKRCGCA